MKSVMNIEFFDPPRIVSGLTLNRINIQHPFHLTGIRYCIDERQRTVNDVLQAHAGRVLQQYLPAPATATFRGHTERNLMSHLDVMLSMDSANMHLASLVNIPVVSIWGATHPYAGFMGWRQLPVNTVQLDLSCRPCSVYGQKPCWRGDYACLRDIKPEQVIAKIEGIVD